MDENSKDLLNVKYYIQNNFKELNDKINQISKEVIYETGFSKEEKSKNNSKEEKNSLKELPPMIKIINT